MNAINEFTGENAFLSNFFPCKITHKELEFQCSEALYMAHKSGNNEDFAKFAPLNGKESKKLGKTVNLQPNWENIKMSVMKEVLMAKFTQNQDLKEKLLATGNLTLIEGNWWGDKFWGVCRGEGENQLGKLLMEVRKELSNGTV
jgi:ribA/ribD-fused uncharacterized protein